MVKASDNAFPSILITEGTEPAAPAVGKQRLYIDSTSKKLKLTDSAGADLTIGPGGAAAIATDTLWAAAGDIAVATGNDAAGVLALGAVGGVVGRVNGAVAWNGGTAFPTMATSDRFYRSDLAMEFYYDGTRKLSVQFGYDPIEGVNGALPITATTFGTHRSPAPNNWGGSDIYLTNVWTSFNVSGGTALSASHKWVGTVAKVAGAVSTTIATITIDSGASSSWRVDTTAISALMNNGTAHHQIAVDWTKTGTPGNLFVMHRLMYRIVAT